MDQIRETALQDAIENDQVESLFILACAALDVDMIKRIINDDTVFNERYFGRRLNVARQTAAATIAISDEDSDLDDEAICKIIDSAAEELDKLDSAPAVSLHLH